MSSKIQFLALDTGEATALRKKFKKTKQNLSKISVLFCHFFIFCLIILIWILATLTIFWRRERTICFKFFSEYEIKQSSAWRELFAIQFALQSFAPKIRNKSVCWETDSYAASLTVTSEIIRHTGSLDLLGTQSHQTSENIKKSRHSRGTPLTLSFILAFFFIILHFKRIE